MIITISGEAGSGKTVVGKTLAKRLKYKYYDMGAVCRKMAEEAGKSIKELMQSWEGNKSFDQKVDDYQANLGKTEDNFVIVGRTSFHFIPHSFKLFLFVAPKEGASRIMSDKADSRKTEQYKDINDAMRQIKERKETDTKRYKNYYGVDIFNRKNYDLFLDTTKMTIEEVVSAVLKETAKSAKAAPKQICPKCKSTNIRIAQSIANIGNPILSEGLAGWECLDCGYIGKDFFIIENVKKRKPFK